LFVLFANVTKLTLLTSKEKGQCIKSLQRKIKENGHQIEFEFNTTVLIPNVAIIVLEPTKTLIHFTRMWYCHTVPLALSQKLYQ